jgi:hypothetical protein
MNRARMSNHASRITLSAGPGIPLMPRFNCNMAGEDRPVIAPVTLT